MSLPTPEYRLHAFCQALGLDLERKGLLLDIVRQMMLEVRDKAKTVCLKAAEELALEGSNEMAEEMRAVAQKVSQVHTEGV